MSKLIYFVLFTVLISCGEKPIEKTTVRGQAFGTTFSIQAYTNQNIDLEKGIDSILNLVNKSVSTYLPDSDISKINRGDTSVIVDQIFIDNFNLSSEVYQKTEGYFDPTIGVLRNAYGFGDIKPLKVIDTKALDLLNANAKEQGFSYEQEVMSKLVDQAMTSNGGVGVAMHENRMVACAVTLADAKQAYYFFGGVDRNSSVQGALGVALNELMNLYRKKGLAVFDFEGSMIPSVENFFRGFGGKQVPYFMVTKAPFVLSTLLRMKGKSEF